MNHIAPPLSAGGRVWRIAEADERLTQAIGQRHKLTEAVARIIAARGIALDAVDAFLEPRLRDALPDPSILLDMDKAADAIADAFEAGTPVAVFGDYDVDGGTSSALILRYARMIGREAKAYIPDRIAEGYGPNAPALLKLKAEGAGLIVCVDCGTTAHAPLTAAVEAGAKIVVLDHHTAEPALPPAIAVVNPNRLDQAPGYGHMAACGVTFLTLVAVNRSLRRRGFFKDRPEPDLAALLDLVALGTVCDVVSLTGINRALVAQGLKILRRRGNPGLAALADVAGLSETPAAWHLGYVFGPRINAGGRVGESDLGVRLLAGDDMNSLPALARMLDGHNRERKAIEDAMLAEALAAATLQAEGQSDPVLLVAGDGWHPGVIGIVAARLKERFHRPACCVAFDGETGKASGRSVGGFDLGAAVIAARQSGLLIAGGGHAMAAGFTVARAAMPALRAFLAERVMGGGGLPRPTLTLDGALAVGGADFPLIRALEKLGPFGAGNPEPRFAILNAKVFQPGLVGNAHVRCLISDPGGSKARLKGIAFRARDTALGDLLLGNAGQPLDLAGTLAIDNWQGEERVSLRIDDAAPAGQMLG